MKKTQKKSQKKSSGKIIGKPTSKGITEGAVMVAGTLAGILLANGISAFIPESYKTPAQAGMAVAGVIGNSAVKGNSTLNKALKAVSSGVAIRGAYDLVSSGLQTLVQPNTNAVGVDKFIQGAVGLGCPGGCGGGYAPAYVNGLGNPFQIETVYDEGADMYQVAQVPSGVSRFL